MPVFLLGVKIHFSTARYTQMYMQMVLETTSKDEFWVRCFLGHPKEVSINELVNLLVRVVTVPGCIDLG